MAKSAKAFLRQLQLHNLCSTHTLITLLRPWIERLTMIISACGFELARNSVVRNQNLRDIGKLETLKAGANSSSTK